MKVWVVERGKYESVCVAGVYSSAERAMAAHPIPADFKYPEAPSPYNQSRPTGWTEDEHGNWRNGLDWDSHVFVSPYDLDDYPFPTINPVDKG